MQRVVGGDEAVARLVDPQVADQATGVRLEGHDQRVVVPRERPVAVARRMADRNSAGQPGDVFGAREVAAVAREALVEQRRERVERQGALEDVDPDGGDAVQELVVADEGDRDDPEPERVADRLAGELERARRVGIAAELRGDGHQRLERATAPARSRDTLALLDRPRRVRGDRGEQP